MSDDVKSGPEIIKDFFCNMEKLKEVDEGVVNIVAKLYQEKKLTNTNLSNELEKLREGKLNDNNQEP